VIENKLEKNPHIHTKIKTEQKKQRDGESKKCKRTDGMEFFIIREKHSC